MPISDAQSTPGARTTYETVREVARRLVRFRRYPPPDGAAWTEAALDELVQGFLAEREGPARLLRLRGALADEHEFELLVERMLKNHLADRGRRTDVGRLHRRLRQVMSQDTRFVRVTRDTWSLADVGSMAARSVDEHVLANAARQAGGERDGPRRRRSTERWTSPDRSTLAEICAAVIRAAGGPVSLSTMTSVVAPVLGVDDAAPGRLAGGEPRGIALAAGAVPSPGPARSIAADIWERLNERERLLFPHLTDPVRRQSEVIGTGHSQAAVAARRLRDRLRILLDGEDQLSQQEIMGHLLEVQARWAGRRPKTPDIGVPSSVGPARLSHGTWGCSIVSQQGDVAPSQPGDIPGGRPRDRARRVIEQLDERRSLAGMSSARGQLLRGAIDYHLAQLRNASGNSLDNAVVEAEQFLSLSR